MNQIYTKPQWSSVTDYLLVTTGSVVGLGNIFQFPYFIAKYGSMFILFYIAFELLISIPIFLAESIIGRRGKQNPIGSVSILAMESRRSISWRYMGWVCFAILFLTLSYYSAEVSQPFSYLVMQIKSSYFNATGGAASISTSSVFTQFVRLSLCFLVFILSALFVVSRGINRGLEGISRVTVPLFFIIFLGLAIYAGYVGNFKATLSSLVAWESSDFSIGMVLSAFSYAFFKLNVGMGTMIVYGSYLPLYAPLGRSTLLVACFDAVASILSYVIIYSIFFIHNDVGSISKLTYSTVPSIFTGAPGSAIVTALFFFGTVVAAWMPTIALAEGVVVTLSQRFLIPRVWAAFFSGIAVILVGFVVLLSSNNIIPVVSLFNRWTISAFISGFAGDILTPISAFLIAIFVGWFVKKQFTQDELDFNPLIYKIWLFLIRFVAPAVSGVLLIYTLIKWLWF